MKNEVAKLEVPELQAIEKSKAEQIRATFEPMVKMLSQFESDYNGVISESQKEITKEVTQKAKRLRLDVAKVRIETGKLKDKQKEYLKLEDRAIMGVHNILVYAVKEKEDKLKEIENYFEIQEQKRLESLQRERVEKLHPYVEDAHERDLSSMDDDVWSAYFSTKKKEYEDRIAAEKKAEQERIEREKAEAEERERIRKENEKLRKEAEERERLAKEIEEIRIKRAEILRPYLVFIKDYDQLISLPENDFKKQFNEIKTGAEHHWQHEKEQKEKEQKEREKQLAKIEAERKERERIEKEEKEKREKLEAELKAKREAEEKAKKEEEARLQSELNKNDAAKVKDLIEDFEALKTKYSFKSKKNQQMYTKVGLLIDKLIIFVKNPEF